MMRRLRRNTELGLILLAAVITAGAYTLAGLGRTATLPADIGPFLIGILALLAAAHLATRRLAPAADGVLLPLANRVGESRGLESPFHEDCEVLSV